MNDAHLITKIENASGQGSRSQPEINLSLVVQRQIKTNMMLGTLVMVQGLTLRLMAIPWQGNRYDRRPALPWTSLENQWVIGHTPDGHQSVAWFPMTDEITT